MTLKITKRPLNDDLEGIVTDLHEAFWPSHEPYLYSGADYWVAMIGDKTAGFAVLNCSQKEGVAYLARSGVLRPFRGQGLQRKLIKVREKWARKQGMKALITETVGNPWSATNLIKEGFFPYEPAIGWNDHDKTTYWRKELT